MVPAPSAGSGPCHHHISSSFSSSEISPEAHALLELQPETFSLRRSPESTVHAHLALQEPLASPALLSGHVTELRREPLPSSSRSPGPAGSFTRGGPQDRTPRAEAPAPTRTQSGPVTSVARPHPRPARGHGRAVPQVRAGGAVERGGQGRGPHAAHSCAAADRALAVANNRDLNGSRSVTTGAHRGLL